MNIDAHYDLQLARHQREIDMDARRESALGAAAAEIEETLLSGHGVMTDFFGREPVVLTGDVALSIDVDALLAARTLYKAGARDAALTAFMAEIERAVAATAEKYAGDLLKARRAE